MKKIILLLILTLIPLVIAQGNLDISLVEYNSETNYARIQISNNLEQDIHNVKFQLGEFPETIIAPTLKSGAATTRVLNVPAGIYKITITSDETTASKEIPFQSSFKEKIEEYEKEQIEKKRTVQIEKVIEQELEKNKPIVEKKSYKNYIIAVTIILIIAIIAYILIKRKR